MKARAGLALTLTLFAIPERAQASDFSGLIPYFIGAYALLYLVLLGAVWFGTRGMDEGWKRSAIRIIVPFLASVAVFAIFLF